MDMPRYFCKCVNMVGINTDRKIRNIKHLNLFKILGTLNFFFKVQQYENQTADNLQLISCGLYGDFSIW